MPQETENLIYWLTLGIGLFVIAVILAVYFIFYYPKDREKEKARRQKVLEEYEKEPEFEFASAKVLKKKHRIYYQTELSMPMLPAEKAERTILFLKEDGVEVEYPVREELFEQIEEGQEGTLVTVNGNFFDFGDGEEVATGETAEETVE